MRVKVHQTLPLLALAAPLLAMTPALAQAQAGGTLDKVKAAGTITLAYRESSIPFSYLDDKAQPVGFGHEICLKIVDEVKKATGRADLKVALQSVTSANRIPLLQNGKVAFTIDQQPYLQGFLPVLYLYMYKLSGGLVFPSETNTGLLFVTKDNVDPYLQTKTRFEGSSTEQQVVERSGAIAG